MRRGINVCVLLNNAPISASAAEAMMFFMILDSQCTGALRFVGSEDMFPRKKKPHPAACFGS